MQKRGELGVTLTSQEIMAQPQYWSKALEQSRAVATLLESHVKLGIAFVGAGSSYYVGITAAKYLHANGVQSARAVPASEYSPREGELAILISRSGTTTEVVEAADAARRGGCVTAALTCEPESILAHHADELISLSYVREESVVQTGSATTAMVLMRAAADHLAGRRPRMELPEELRKSLDEDVEPLVNHGHVVVLGSKWSFGVACEAALKLQEMARLWTERYIPLEYRHGPMSCAGERTHVEVLDAMDARIGALANDVKQTGARVHIADSDPFVTLVRLQRIAVETALHKGLNPDQPMHLTRSVVLEESDKQGARVT